MKTHLKTFSSGYGVSLLGALPLGTLNITAFKIAVTKSLWDGLLFAIAVVFTEILVVRLCLFAASKMNINSKLSFYLYPIAIIFLIYLAVSNFISSQELSEVTENGSSWLPQIESAFLLGLLLSAVNPLQFPYWIGWNKIMLERKVLEKNITSTTSYLMGIGIGTLTALLLFIFVGSYIFKNFDQYNNIITLILGFIYIGFAIYLLILFYKKHLKSMINYV